MLVIHSRSHGSEKAKAGHLGVASVFTIRGGGSAYEDLTAAKAAAKARELRLAGLNDVEIFRADHIRISQYALDQIVRSAA